MWVAAKANLLRSLRNRRELIVPVRLHLRAYEARFELQLGCRKARCVARTRPGSRYTADVASIVRKVRIASTIRHCSQHRQSITQIEMFGTPNRAPEFRARSQVAKLICPEESAHNTVLIGNSSDFSCGEFPKGLSTDVWINGSGLDLAQGRPSQKCFGSRPYPSPHR